MRVNSCGTTRQQNPIKQQNQSFRLSSPHQQHVTIHTLVYNQQEHVASSSCDTFKVRDRSLTQVSQVRGHSTESRLSTQCKIREPCATRGTLCCSSDPTFSPSPGRGLGRTTVNKRTTRRCSERTLTCGTLNMRLLGEDGHNT